MSETEFQIGEEVLFKNNERSAWSTGIFEGQTENGLYRVNTGCIIEDFAPSEVMKK